MLITQKYKELNKELHETREDYGVGGAKWAQVIVDLANNLETRDVLDYGCGKGALKKKLAMVNVKNYDPALEEFSAPPEPADIVCCFDVLEHVEPDCITDVIRDLKRLAKRALVVVVATRPAVKFLSDGRNAHLIQKNVLWWINKIGSSETCQIQQINNMEDKEFLAIYANKAYVEMKDKVTL